MTAKKLSAINLGELLKRVPPNQLKEFEAFRAKTLEYKERVNKYPDKLPAIDWAYYRKNVRQVYVKMVEQFQVKYEALGRNFANRHKVLDHSKYYTELEQLKVKAEDEIKKFIAESNKHILAYEQEIQRVKSFNYEGMTMEQYIELREEEADLIPGQGKPLFWPHTPEEQLGYVQKPEKSDEAQANEKKP